MEQNPNMESNEVHGKRMADQIEMYKAYEEMFGVDEAAGMMGLDTEEVKRLGIETILKRKQMDSEAAEAARSCNGASSRNGTRSGTNGRVSAQRLYSEEMLFAQAIQAATFNGNLNGGLNGGLHGALNGNHNGLNTTAAALNAMEFSLAPGTTHTAGGRTVSRPPPPGVGENGCIFVGDLHPSVTRADVASVFGRIGRVQWIQLFDCHKEMRRPFNFAFVYFEDSACAQRAIDQLNYTKFYGAPCRLMWKQERNAVQWTDCNIIVKNLPPSTDSQVLHTVFCKFGEILSSKVKTAPNGRTLPYGYVQFATKEGAERAIGGIQFWF